MKTKTIYLVLILGISAFFVIYLPLQPYFDVHAVEEERIELEGEYNSKSFSLWGNGSTFYTGGYINEKALLIRWDCAGNMLWNRTWGSSKMVTELWGDANSVFAITEDTYYQFSMKSNKVNSTPP